MTEDRRTLADVEIGRDRASNLFDQVSAERNQLVRRVNELESTLRDVTSGDYDLGYSPADTITRLREELAAAKAERDDLLESTMKLLAEHKAAKARIAELDSELDATRASSDRATKLFELVSAERNELVRRVNELERMKSSGLRVAADEGWKTLHSWPVSLKTGAKNDRWRALGPWRDTEAEAQADAQLEHAVEEARRFHSVLHDAASGCCLHTLLKHEHACAMNSIESLREKEGGRR